MKVLIVDDERIVLATETSAIKRVLPDAKIESFQKATDAIEYAKMNIVDIAFLDINIRDISGLELAKELQKCNPKINIIFCTGYTEYSLDAHDLYCSAYLMKPLSDEKILKALEKLRYPTSGKIERFKVCCFGNFEVLIDGVPIRFRNQKTKELFAFLVDRHGATVSTKEIMVALYEDNNKESYIRNLRADLKNTLETLGVSEILVHSGGKVGVNVKKIDCDYYDYLDGQKELFRGEYMSQYSFAEQTLGGLLNTK